MTQPVNLILNLWSLGHQAGDIKARLGLSSRDVVTRIVLRARGIGDARAVYHLTRTGRIMGEDAKPNTRRKRWKGFDVVRAIEPPPTKTCIRGHLRTADNLFNRGCLVCKRERQRLAYHARKAS
jgi:hypothetical protein